MDGKHLDRATIEQLLEKKLAAEETSSIGRHLWNCPVCRRRVSSFAPNGSQFLDGLLAAANPERTSEYRSVFANLRSQLAQKALAVKAEIDSAPRLFEELLACQQPERMRRVQLESRFHSRALVERILEECRQRWATDPSAAEDLADLALEVIERLGSEVSAPTLNDLRARRWAYLGNIRRIQTDLRTVEDAFTLAESFLDLGTGDPLGRAEVLDLKASLRRDQRRLIESTKLLNRAIGAYHRAGDQHLVGRALLKKAIVHYEAQEPTRSIALLRKASGLIDATREPRLRYTVLQQLAAFLHQAGRSAEAQSMLPGLREMATKLENRFELLRLSWIEGLIAIELGDRSKAEELLTEARRGFIEEGIGYDAALVSLDLAVLYLGQNRTAEVKQLAAEMLPIFQSRDIHREAMAALMVFRRAVELESATVSMVEEIAANLKRAAYSSNLSFERPS